VPLSERDRNPADELLLGGSADYSASSCFSDYAHTATLDLLSERGRWLKKTDHTFQKLLRLASIVC
jgi:hypothetical protein